MAYVIDSDVFIRAKNDHYGFSFCPAFWEWLLREHSRGRLYSIEAVLSELTEQEDEVSAWAEGPGRGLFIPTAPDVFPSLTRVSAWAASGAYTPVAVNAFLSKADYFLTGQALARGDVVVTHEIPARSPNKIKIPDACIAMGIRVITPFTMLAESRARFILG